MQKLKLDIDRLAVESFPTSAAAGDGLGTVHARGVDVDVQDTVKIVCTISTIATNPTCCPCTP